MWKKITALLLALLLALFAFAYYQFNQQQQRLKASLEQQGIKFASLSVRVFPSLQANVQQLDYQVDEQHQLHFEQAMAEFRFLPLLKGELAFEQVQFEQGSLYRQQQLQWKNIQLQIQPQSLNVAQIKPLIQQWHKQELPADYSDNWAYQGSLSAENPHGDKINLAGNLKLRQQSALLQDFSFTSLMQNQDSWLKNQDLKLAQAELVWQAEGAQFALQNAKFNQQDFAQIQGTVRQIKSENAWLLNFSSCDQCQTSLQFSQPAQNQQKIHWQSQGIELEQWQKALNINPLISGKGEIQAQIALSNYQPQQMQGRFNVQHGSLQGVNILSMVGRYLPINFDEQQSMDTSFEQLAGDMNWNQQQLQLDKFALLTPQLRITASGNANLTNMQCDFSLNVGVNKEGYRDFSLPIRLFDNCQSPQYQIQINQDFRHQLKNLLKQKFGG